MTPRQIKELIKWAKKQNILTIKVNNVEVTFHPNVVAPKVDAKGVDLTKLFEKKSREDLLKEEDDLLFAAVN